MTEGPRVQVIVLYSTWYSRLSSHLALQFCAQSLRSETKGDLALQVNRRMRAYTSCESTLISQA